MYYNSIFHLAADTTIHLPWWMWCEVLNALSNTADCNFNNYAQFGLLVLGNHFFFHLK